MEEDLDLPIDNLVPKTCDLRCLARTLTLLSPVSPQVGMLISSRNSEKLSTYIPLMPRHSPDTIVALQAALGSVGVWLGQPGGLNARHPT